MDKFNKNKILVTLLTGFTSFCFMFGFTACDKPEENNGKEVSEQEWRSTLSALDDINGLLEDTLQGDYSLNANKTQRITYSKSDSEENAVELSSISEIQKYDSSERIFYNSSYTQYTYKNFAEFLEKEVNDYTLNSEGYMVYDDNILWIYSYNIKDDGTDSPQEDESCFSLTYGETQPGTDIYIFDYLFGFRDNNESEENLYLKDLYSRFTYVDGLYTANLYKVYGFTSDEVNKTEANTTYFLNEYSVTVEISNGSANVKLCSLNPSSEDFLLNYLEEEISVTINNGYITEINFNTIGTTYNANGKYRFNDGKLYNYEAENVLVSNQTISGDEYIINDYITYNYEIALDAINIEVPQKVWDAVNEKKAN